MIRKTLQDKAIPTQEWEKAIHLLSERITERYFEPLHILISNGTNKGEGFTIVTIECALIEFLATLVDGKLFKKDKSNNDSHWYYSKSARIYQQFLKKGNIFDGYFFSSNGNPVIFSAYDFYRNVRCALIHEAQTRENWEIKIFGKSVTKDIVNNIIFEITPENKKIIYRTALCKALENYFNTFIDIELTQRNNRGKTLRKHLARKIDYIAEVSPDNSFWWK